MNSILVAFICTEFVLVIHALDCRFQEHSLANPCYCCSWNPKPGM